MGNRAGTGGAEAGRAGPQALCFSCPRPYNPVAIPGHTPTVMVSWLPVCGLCLLWPPAGKFSHNFPHAPLWQVTPFNSIVIPQNPALGSIYSHFTQEEPETQREVPCLKVMCRASLSKKEAWTQ